MVLKEACSYKAPSKHHVKSKTNIFSAGNVQLTILNDAQSEFVQTRFYRND